MNTQVAMFSNPDGLVRPDAPVRQRADLTFKQNRSHGRHGWLRLTPAYSVKLVDEILREYGQTAARVLDPFSGTGTTPLSASYFGCEGISTDVNPFLVWLGNVKGRNYSATEVAEFAATLGEVNGLAESLPDSDVRPAPQIANITRWWHARTLNGLLRLASAIALVETSDSIRSLLYIAFSRTMIASSNAAFNHQSMSFKSAKGVELGAEQSVDLGTLLQAWLADAAVVSDSLGDNPTGSVKVLLDDARVLASIGDSSIDALITSPPYPNRMSYIRELRPYMYWLNYIQEAREAGELDWLAIGGTWGVATSRLKDWVQSRELPSYLQEIAGTIGGSHEKNGLLMANYVLKYFEDMDAHFEAASRVVRSGGTAHYIIGNASFYGHLVPAERIYCDQLRARGFQQVEARVIRKRNSKRELIEFHVLGVRE